MRLEQMVSKGYQSTLWILISFGISFFIGSLSEKSDLDTKWCHSYNIHFTWKGENTREVHRMMDLLGRCCCVTSERLPKNCATPLFLCIAVPRVVWCGPVVQTFNYKSEYWESLLQNEITNLTPKLLKQIF